MLKRFFIAGLCSSLLLLGTVSLWAASGRVFSRIGEIQQVDAAMGFLEIDDTRFALAKVRIYAYDLSAKDLKDQRDKRLLKRGEDLREGMLIGYNVENEGAGKKGHLTELWILPTE